METLRHDLFTLSPGMILWWILIFAFIIQLFYYFFFFIRVSIYKRHATEENLPPVSIIICARNEEANLVTNLPLIFNQEYPEFEVVVVNDCSYDNTGDVLKEFGKKYSNLKVVTIKEDEYYRHGKKVAVMMGIKGAKHEHLMLTDADCRPSATSWLRSMISHFGPGTELVLGYGPYERSKGFLNKVIRFDAFFIGLQYLSYALAGVAYMGVGRNLAYRRELFFRMKGFASHYHIPSGDDDLFVNEAASRRNTRVELDPGSFCFSNAKPSFREWWFQKKRHVETGKRYRLFHKLLLGTYMMTQWLFFGCFVAALILRFQPYLVLSVFITRFLVQLLIFNFGMKRLGERDLLLLAPFYEILLMLFYPLITFSHIFQRKRRWS
ncbi:MAG TPA: glycosyltransferase [Bacteroidia bacterium]|nr:glycosyltransferase [Bacteroidia bacterium]